MYTIAFSRPYVHEDFFLPIYIFFFLIDFEGFFPQKGFLPNSRLTPWRHTTGV